MPTLCSRFLRALALVFIVGNFGHHAGAAEAQPSWAYRGEITNPGSRSEGFRGMLYFHGQAVPGALEEVMTPLGVYAYNPPENASPWSRYGWIKAAKPMTIPPASAGGAPVSSQEHWYTGAKRPGMPGNWIYLPKRDVWLDPASMAKFVESNAGTPQGAGTSSSLVALADSLASGNTAHNESVFEYRLTEVSSGTKSAHEEGSLLIGGKAVSGVWLQLKTPIGSFHHMQSDLPWQDKGWLPDATEAVVQDSTEAFTHEQELAGRYQGKRLVGMPSNWCYSPLLDMWLSPAHLVQGR